ncbi:WD40 repeat-like protein [Ramaria rubella]|nr:WD40 repeat-like protein [Ramaria rubella]
MSLHDQFQSGVLVSSFKLLTQVKVTMDNGIDELRKDLKRDYLAKLLPHVQSAKYDTSQQCLKGTRDILLDSILEWMSDEDVSPILWINGQAGAGKSTIAHTVASYADEACQLGACFFLHRDYAEKRNPHLIINTLAFQLAHFHHQIAEEIDQALARDPDLGYTLAVGDHFHKLIVQPLANLPSTSGQILILIDDLDALDAMDQQKITVRDAFLQCLADVGNQLPKFVKFFLTSRADWDISQTLSPLNTIRVIPLKLDDMETRGDLEKVAKKYIAKMHLKFPRLTNSWPGEEVINALVSKAAGLFIWMTTACNFILQRNPESRLQIVLGSKSKKNPEAGLDELYRKTILHHMDAQEDLDNEFFDNFRQTMGVIATLQSPLAAKTLDALLNLKVSTEDTINLLMAVLYIGKDSAIHPIHPSFIDFLSNKNRCQDDQLYIDVNFYHQQLAECCLDKMQSDSGLIRNICHLIDSSKFNEEIENLQVQLDIYVSKELRYACIFWAEHLSVTTPTQKLVAKLNIFVNVHMLHWLEAMSLLKEYGSALPALKKITNWYKSFSNKDEQFLQLLYDSQRFVQEFQIPISLSALHVYYSALPFTPEGTILFGHFQNNLNDSVKVLSGKNHKWSPCLQVFEGHSGTVNSVLFTPDGMKLISCSSDKTVCIWEVETGRPIVTYLEGHTDRIECMDISPDGTKLVTGSKDTTLQIWDLATNEHRPLEGHAAVVYGVAFSPDGNKIVSGSKDRTLCLWDVKTGKQIGQPLKGHTGVVSFVKFSPDGHFILSGSVDTTLCLWDAETGNQHGKPLKGHTASVIIGAFSPDGNIIASGSVDKTICLWNVKTSQQLGAPLIGHRMSVHALAFSPDGSKVVTGCGDTTLYCWDIITRKQQGSPLEGHTATINAVAFSPDGSKVVSASDDSTIRLWDATVSENAELLLVKHTGMVRSFAFSPDGGKIASTCMDNSIYLWDSATGKYLRKPFAGHMASICSIAFSPDGRKIVSGAEDSTIRIWNVSTGKQMGQSIQWLDSHELQSVAFSFEGSKIVACTKYIPHFFWEAKTGKFIGTLSEQQAGRLIAPTVQTPSQRLLTVGPTPHYITSNERPQKFPLDMHVNIHDGWVLLANKRLFWVPPTYRGNCFAVQDHMMVMGAGSGRVTIMDGSGPLEMMAETLR